eukprot:TRINITY_DN8284_c0_g1_i2.p1 TRINITY_DN8284_c0_g1~~TRINITY_DN8284_c0_g1_i2.p1  ORF type:complete len:385 (+),score=85.65 TRINITY_DN8284_c0_g1_i2:188-1342(+)
MLLSLLCLTVAFTFGAAKINEDAFLSFTDILKKYNYKYEKHEAITEDGHKLVVYRVPPQANSPHKREPVYLQHGVLCTPEAFVAGGQEGSILFFLVRRGYDVWVPNSRGSLYSREHTKYAADDERYWNFTFEDQGRYDQRAVIDLIMNVTGYQKVHYWSHSMGGTQMLAALLEEPDYYRQHLYSAILAGPVFRFDTTKSPFIQILNYTKILYILRDLGIHSFFPYLQSLSFGQVWLKSILGPIYDLVLKFVTEENSIVTDSYNIDVFYAHFPAGTSTKCFKHLIQLTEHTGFFKYREKASDPVVPYDFRALPDDIPLAVYVGEYDTVGSPISALWFHQQMLKFRKKVHIKVYKNIGHASFLAPLKENFAFLHDTVSFFENAVTS